MTYEKHYYDGAWQTSTGTETIAVISSATEAGVRARAARNGARTSIARSRRRAAASTSWSRLPVEERAQWLEKLSAAMKTRVPQIAEAIAHEVGTALGFATKVQAEFPIMMIGMNAKFIREAKLEEELGNSLVIKEPIGVVGQHEDTEWRHLRRLAAPRCIPPPGPGRSCCTRQRDSSTA